MTFMASTGEVGLTYTIFHSFVCENVFGMVINCKLISFSSSFFGTRSFII